MAEDAASRPAAGQALRGGATLAVGFAGGALFFALNLPLPWLLGAALSTALASRVGAPLALPKSWRGYAMAIIGTMLGSGFQSGIGTEILHWLPSIVTMLLLSVVFQIGGYGLLRRFSDMSPEAAFLAAAPGGLSAVTSIADGLTGEVHRIALVHTVRLITLLATAPIMIHLVSDFDLADANRLLLNGQEDFAPWSLAVLAVFTVAGWALARKIGFNSGQLIFPLIFSAALHASGTVETHIPLPVAVLAQLVIGSNVGMRFRGYSGRDILSDGWIAALIGLGLAGISLAAALLVSVVTSQPVPPLLLAFLPGGAPELGVVALSLGINPAMVAAHHSIRVTVISATLPAAIRRLTPAAQNL